MSEAVVSTTLKALAVGIPRHGSVLTWDLICLTREVWTSDQGGGLICNRLKSGYIVSSNPCKNQQHNSVI